MPFGDLPQGWALAGALDRWALYAGMTLAAGSAMFLLAFAPTGPVERTAVRVGDVAAAIAAVAYLLAVGFLGADLIDAPGALFTSAAWQLGTKTNLLPSALMGVLAMAFLSVGFRGASSSRAFLLSLGTMLALGSFLLTGHAATAEPRWLALTSVAAHLACAAFWFGALAPLATAARTLPASEAGALMVRFSRLAAWAVGGVIASGVAIAWIQLHHLRALTSTAYGARLDVKIALALLLLGLAGYNKLVLTPRLTAGDANGAAALRRAIAVEYALFLLIFAAAVGLTLVEPPRVLMSL